MIKVRIIRLLNVLGPGGGNGNIGRMKIRRIVNDYLEVIEIDKGTGYPIIKCSCLEGGNGNGNGNGNDGDGGRIQEQVGGRAGRLNTRSKLLCKRPLIQRNK